MHETSSVPLSENSIAPNVRTPIAALTLTRALPARPPGSPAPNSRAAPGIHVVPWSSYKEVAMKGCGRRVIEIPDMDPGMAS